MTQTDPRARRRPATDPRDARTAVLVLGAAVLAVLAVFVFKAPARSSGAAEETVASTAAATRTAEPTGRGLRERATRAENGAPDVEGVDAEIVEASADACTIGMDSLGSGDAGDDVRCLQRALIAAGFLSGTPSGEYDGATYDAVRTLQEERDLFVDGVAGRETALSVGVWPDEESAVVRTPPPPDGAVDELGFPLSSVSSVGKDAPPLPENSGSGRRVVYERLGQRVWAVADDGHVIRSWLVSGSKYSNEVPGTHAVYSRSDVSTAWNGRAWLPLMIRWYETEIGHIGFHAIPLHVEDNSAYQTEAELGSRLSGGCQRQANPDAQFLWSFAQIGTPVVVT